MRYHNITKADMLNGDGLRVVLWVSGCSHACPGCHNQITWNPKDGLEFDEEAKNEIFQELEQDWCAGITFSGGDPLFKGNRATILELAKEIKSKFPTKNIWCYTGFTWEELHKEGDPVVMELLEYLDVVLDGKFMLQLKDDNIHYVGSRNQRIIDVQASRKENKIVLFIDNGGI